MWISAVFSSSLSPCNKQVCSGHTDRVVSETYPEILVHCSLIVLSHCIKSAYLSRDLCKARAKVIKKFFKFENWDLRNQVITLDPLVKFTTTSGKQHLCNMDTCATHKIFYFSKIETNTCQYAKF